MDKSVKDISLVISLLHEAESLPELHTWIRRVMEENNLSSEIIMVDDGSTVSSWDMIRRLSEEDKSVRGISFRRKYVKSAAL